MCAGSGGLGKVLEGLLITKAGCSCGSMYGTSQQGARFETDAPSPALCLICFPSNRVDECKQNRNWSSHCVKGPALDPLFAEGNLSIPSRQMCVYLLRRLISLPVDLDFVPGSFFFPLLLLYLPPETQRDTEGSRQFVILVLCRLSVTGGQWKNRKWLLVFGIGGESWSKKGGGQTGWRSFTFTLFFFAIWASEMEVSAGWISFHWCTSQVSVSINTNPGWIRREIRFGSGG